MENQENNQQQYSFEAVEKVKKNSNILLQYECTHMYVVCVHIHVHVHDMCTCTVVTMNCCCYIRGTHQDLAK